MKIEMKRSVIEILDDDDDDFFSQVAAVEAEALASSKRRRSTPPINSVVQHPKKEVSAAAAGGSENDGSYMAALKGNQSLVRQSTDSNPLRGGRVANGRLNVVDAGNDNVFSGGGDSCFKCGKSGHWARDCDSAAGGGGGWNFGNYGAGSDDPSIPEKSCPCGLGICNVLTANTEKNRGRKFYKCPLRQENGGCGFFEWCDNASGNNSMAAGNYTSDSSFPGLPCPCGAGLCLILTAKTGKNIGQQFYKCPANQGSSCGFFKWCNENVASVGVPVSTPKEFYNSSDTNNGSYNVRTGSSCFKCGKEGHWAKDCSIPSSNPSAELGVRSASLGTCYKCGKPGHWSRDCSSY